MTALAMNKSRIDDANTVAFRRALLQRWLEGDHFTAGDYRIYLAYGCNIEERKVKPADYETVRLALVAMARESIKCANCGCNEIRMERYMLQQHSTDQQPAICCEVTTLPTARCQHQRTETNTAGSPVCQECGTSW